MLTSMRTAAPVAVAHDERRARIAAIPTDRWILLGLTLLAAVLRFATLTHQSYWFDEAQAAHELHLSFGAMLSSWSANEPNPPLYFIVAWPWAQIFGTGEAGLRSLSAIVGVVVIPIVWLCGRELVSSRAGLVAAAFAAVNPFLIWYSQEAREYMLLTALCGASVLMFVRAYRAPSRRTLGWWAVVSALALATQYFAAFLVVPEAFWLLYALRDRGTAIAVSLPAVVGAALLPHAIAHAPHPTAWIESAGSLSVRLGQVPVAFGFNTLYRSGSWLANHGLLGAAVLALALILLLVIGADARELRGAGIASALAACVLLIPLVLALAGHDYYEPRALLPAWIPLAIVIGAACTAHHLRLPGAMLAVLLLAAFVWGEIKINGHISYQRPNWRGVAAALGRPTGPRAIVTYDGTFAAAPLAVYLPGVAWTGTRQIPQPSEEPVTVAEVDVVGNPAQRLANPLPAGVSLIASNSVDGYQIARFRLARPWQLSRAAIGQRAPALLGPAAPGPAVLVQQPTPATLG